MKTGMVRWTALEHVAVIACVIVTLLTISVQQSRAAGTVSAWGWNALGQLGNGTITDSGVPVPVPGLTNVTKIAASSSFSLALLSDGTVWAWGANSHGQLGNGTSSPYVRGLVPGRVTGLTNAIAIAAGGSHTAALRSDGTVWAWGSNSSGQLGNGTIINSSVPIQVTVLTDCVAIAAGGSHNAALRSDGTVWAWGSNSSGQLGNGTTINSSIPVQVTGLTDCVAIDAGEYHTVAQKSDGTVWTWGWNWYGQFGNGTSTHGSSIPVQASGLTDCVAIDTAWASTAALKSDGTVWTWGNTLLYGSVPTMVGGLTNCVGIAAGSAFTAALKSDGSVWTRGSNAYGQLGTGRSRLFGSDIPLPVAYLFGVTSIAGGSLHALAVSETFPAIPALTASANPSEPGQPITFTAALAGGLPTGTAQFVIDGVNVGSPIALTDGTAHYTTSTLSDGSHQITALYSGDANNPSSSSTTLTQVIAWPTPILSIIRPRGTMATTGAVTITLTGEDFIPLSTVSFGGATIPTTYVSRTTLTAQVPADAVLTPGDIPVVVSNPAPGGGTSKELLFTVMTPSLTSVSTYPSTVIGTVASTGTLTLNGPVLGSGLDVALSSDNAAVVVPASVTIPAGQSKATFPVTTNAVDADTAAVITATSGGVTKRCIHTVKTATARSLQISPYIVSGGATVTGLITFTAPVGPSPLTVTLSSSNTAVAQAPATIQVPAGASSASFSITTSPVAAGSMARITTTGHGSVSAALTAMPPVLTSVTATPSPVQGGKSVTITAALGSPAPAGGTTVKLVSSLPGVLSFSPASITVPAGAMTASIVVTPAKVKASQPVTITAILGRVMQKTAITVTP